MVTNMTYSGRRGEGGDDRRPLAQLPVAFRISTDPRASNVCEGEGLAEGVGFFTGELERERALRRARPALLQHEQAVLRGERQRAAPRPVRRVLVQVVKSDLPLVELGHALGGRGGGPVEFCHGFGAYVRMPVVSVIGAVSIGAPVDKGRRSPIRLGPPGSKGERGPFLKRVVVLFRRGPCPPRFEKAPFSYLESGGKFIHKGARPAGAKICL